MDELGDETTTSIPDFHPERDAQRVFEEAIPATQQGEVWRGDLAWQRHDGEEVNTASVIQAHRDQSDRIISYSVVARDISDKLRYEAFYRDAPLGIVILSEDFGHLIPEEGHDYLNRMRDAAKRMSELLDDLLSYSRVGKNEQRIEPVDLNVVLAEVSDFMEARLRESNGRIDVGDLPTVHADRSQMTLLFQNLVSNGLKFRRPGVPPVVEVQATATGGQATITVADNGIGFENKYLDRIFEVFQRLHGRGSSYTGTGIGLAIARRIVEGHNGVLSADGRPGEGATFTVELPVG